MFLWVAQVRDEEEHEVDAQQEARQELPDVGEMGTNSAFLEQADTPTGAESDAPARAPPVAVQEAPAPEAAVSARTARKGGDGLDAKPALTSWEMAKFANNVDSAQGQLGTNVAWMYDSLAKRGAYNQVPFHPARRHAAVVTGAVGHGARVLRGGSARGRVRRGLRTPRGLRPHG